MNKVPTQILEHYNAAGVALHSYGGYETIVKNKDETETKNFTAWPGEFKCEIWEHKGDVWVKTNRKK